MRRSFLSACCALLLAQAGVAQAADPITGKWTGDIGLSDTDRHSVTFELKLAANGGIDGTVQGPGPATLKSGSFDAKTGALRLNVDVIENGRPALFLFEGVAVAGVVTGRVSGNGETGTFRLTMSSAGFGQKSAGDASAALQRGFSEINDWISKAAELVPAEKYSYRPTDSVRTFGQQIAHVADSYTYYCSRAAGNNVEWTEAVEKGSTDKATLTAKLKSAVAICNAAYSGAGDTGALLANLGHTSLHYGNIVTYMRMLGLVPPSS